MFGDVPASFSNDFWTDVGKSIGFSFGFNLVRRTPSGGELFAALNIGIVVWEVVEFGGFTTWEEVGYTSISIYDDFLISIGLGGILPDYYSANEVDQYQNYSRVR